MANTLTEIDYVAGVKVWDVEGAPRSFVFKSGAMVNADGSPNCYGPDNSGIDYTANGGTPGGDWWGGPVNSTGMPLIQKIYEPSPGMYVCGTALVIPGYADSIQYRYVDSEAIPFFVLPGGHNNDARLGDVGLVYNSVNGANCYGIYADVGPKDKIGEISLRMAEALDLNANPKSGGTKEKTIVTLVFPGSVGAWKPPNVWFDVANTLTHSWGGLSRLKEIAKVI